MQSIVRSQVSCGHETNIQVGLKDGICGRKRPQKRSQSVYFENYSCMVGVCTGPEANACYAPSRTECAHAGPRNLLMLATPMCLIAKYLIELREN